MGMRDGVLVQILRLRDCVCATMKGPETLFHPLKLQHDGPWSPEPVVPKSVCPANSQDRQRPSFTWNDGISHPAPILPLLWLPMGSSGARGTEKRYCSIRARSGEGKKRPLTARD